MLGEKARLAVQGEFAALIATEAAVEIRAAAAGDAAAIAAVHVEAWREAHSGIVPAEQMTRLTVPGQTEFWRAALGGADMAVFVAGAPHGAVLGFGACGPQRDPDLAASGYSGEIQATYVQRTAQRCGLGRALMARMARHMVGHGWRGGAVWVLSSNVPARTFYEQLGGRAVGDRIDLWDNGLALMEVAYGWPNLFALAGT